MADSTAEFKSGSAESDKTVNSTPAVSEENLYIYPVRRGGNYEKTWFQSIFFSPESLGSQKLKCERNVIECVRNSPLVKLMISALQSSGCELDLLRHISCEPCADTVVGGYDPDFNQVVICQNVATSRSAVQGALSHELLHMFDYCRANLNFHDIEHLACTEIRAANLMHCSFLNAWTLKTASPLKIAQAHKDCVKHAAVSSIVAVRNVPIKEAERVVDKVFDKCYNDLEPVGRRLRRNSDDMERAYRERNYYGYQ